MTNCELLFLFPLMELSSPSRKRNDRHNLFEPDGVCCGEEMLQGGLNWSGVPEPYLPDRNRKG